MPKITPETYLELGRRHTAGCPHRAKGRGWTKCRCPIWCDGKIEGRRYRRSMGTDWARALRKVQEIQTGRRPAAPPEASLVQAAGRYLEALRGRNLAERTISSRTYMLQHLQEYAGPIQAKALPGLLEGYPGWALKRWDASTVRLQRSQIRSFSKWCLEHGLIAQMPTVPLVRAQDAEAQPFTEDEARRLIAACQKPRERALLLVGLYTGFRISDIIRLERSRVDLETGRMLIRVMKTGRNLFIRLQPEALEALQALPAAEGTERWFFWKGSNILAATTAARKLLYAMARRAGVEHVYPHRMRDTFATTLLANGAAIRDVQLLLGHRSVVTTERHYAGWIKKDQERVEALVDGLKY